MASLRPSRKQQNRTKDERHAGKTGEVTEMQVAGHEIAGVRAENARRDESQPVGRIDPGKIAHAGLPCTVNGPGSSRPAFDVLAPRALMDRSDHPPAAGKQARIADPGGPCLEVLRRAAPAQRLDVTEQGG